MPDCNEKQVFVNILPPPFVSVSTDNMQVTLDKSHNFAVAHLISSQSSDNLPQRYTTLNNSNVGSNFSDFTVQHWYSSLCEKNNILATLNDTKHRQKIFDKKIGFVAVPISRVSSRY